MNPETPAPHQAYYQACNGSWESPLLFRFTSLQGMLRSKMRWINRLSMASMMLAMKLGLRPVLATTVAFETEDCVLHTTDVRLFGVPLMRSVERIVLHGDGQRGSITGQQRMMPLFWYKIQLSGDVVVAADAMSAEYRFIWLGEILTQTTRRESGGVRIAQRTGWFRGEQFLA